jgi:Mg2+-importing ATPase
VQLLRALHNPFIYVLLTLADQLRHRLLAAARAGQTDDADLTKVIIIMTMVSAQQPAALLAGYRSTKAADALKAMVRTTATVLRREQVGQPRAARSAHGRTGGRRHRAAAPAT